MSDVGGDMVLPSVSVDVLSSMNLLLHDAGNKFVLVPSVLDDMPIVLEVLSNPLPADRDVPSSFEQAPLSLERDYSIFLDDLVDLDVYIDTVDACDLYDDDFFSSMDDFDVELFYNESSIVPEHEEKITEASTRFGIATAAELKNVRRGGERRSEASERWAAKAFDDWRQFWGISTSKSVGDLLEELDLKPFAEMLTRFILEVKKKDGSHYHPNR
jgi:hypothetical protein